MVVGVCVSILLHVVVVIASITGDCRRDGCLGLAVIGDSPKSGPRCWKKVVA